MSRIKDENYFQVSGWMLNRLQLKGSELYVYAIIYGFTQDGESWFTGSRQYIADFIGCSSKRTVDNCLENLVNKGLLEKRELTQNGVKFCHYKANCTSGAKIAPGVVQNLHRGGAKIAPYNNTDNNIDNKDNPPCIPPSEETVTGVTELNLFDGEQKSIVADSNIVAELKQRINVLFHRRQSTTWTVKETTTLRQIAKRNGVLDEMSEIEALYNSGYPYRRRNVDTFLNQWAGELDRARNKTQAAVSVSKYDRTTREVDYDPGF